MVGWTTYTPTTTGITAGSGVFDFAYMQVGKTVHVRGSFILGSSSAVTSNVSFSLPIAASTTGKQFGPAIYKQGTWYEGVAYSTGPTYVNLYAKNSASTYASLTAINGVPVSYVPVQWLSGHSIEFTITYQAA
jgi:hypothetical protein